ncbi:MAG TPA: ArsA-related P-loop ATPase [Thermodesulfobacteriota bacterium]|nr:ArsA-related P-loop ATPase [Thermodesulfobacteriota bacterium]
MNQLERLIRDKRIIVCIGPGGVGKTTISSALALESASIGRKTLALTIDPSRRLAQSLGLSPRISGGKVSAKRMMDAGYSGKGELTVRILDVKKTFDDLIAKVSRSEEAASRILANKYYTSVADSLAGAHEFMAMEALYSSYAEGGYDLIVVDTPPSEHISDFLSAPLRLSSILDSQGFRSFFIMDKLSFGLTKLVTSVSLKFVQSIVGLEVIHDMWEFFSEFESVSGDIKTRAEKTFRLLKSPETSFLIVTNLAEAAVGNTLEWEKELASTNHALGAVVVNRTREDWKLPALKPGWDGGLGINPGLRRKLEGLYGDYKRESDAEKKAFKKLGSEFPYIPVPEIDTEVTGLRDIRNLREYLFG